MLFKSLMQSKNETSDEPSGVTHPERWFMNLFGTSSASGEKVTAQSAVGVPTVYACVNILANSVAKLPFQTFKKSREGKKERDTKHAVAKLLEERPNPFQNPFQFKHHIETHRNTWGNAYINIAWGANGYPESLWLLDPSVTEPVVDIPTNTLWYWTSLPDGKHIKIPSDDIVHIHTMSLDGIKGKSPIQIAREAIGSSQAAQKFKGKFYKNGASPNGILKVPGQLNREAKDKVREEWETANAGINNAQRVAILDAGLEYQSIGMPLRDAQFIEGMKYDKTEIANIFNIPLHMINELDRSTHSNIEQQALDFIQNTLSPILIQYEQEFTYKLFTEIELRRYYLKFNLTSLLRADSEARANYYEKMVNIGAYSINDVRDLEDKDAIENGDKHFVSLNYTTLDLLEDYQRAKSGEGGGNSEE